jgi:TetR/AcrR family transcriptional repressor of lmrAB and yxaGH operons
MTKDLAPAPISRDEIVVRLFDLFRHAGYEGVSIGDISQATGLGRSSLYHYFPGGKADMAAAVVGFAKQWVAANILAPLRDATPLETRIDRMLAAVRGLYRDGAAPCLVASMLLSRGRDPVDADVGALIRGWIDELAATLEREGLSAGDAAERATAGIIVIEGALIVARAAERLDIFDAALAQARHILLRRGEITMTLDQIDPMS